MAAGRVRRPGRHTRCAAVLSALGLVLLLPACSRGVEVTAAPEASSAACRAASAKWPATVGNHKAVDTTSDSPAVHAWGDPAVIARCGVAPPGPTTDQCIEVSGVDWVAHRLSDGVRFTTFGRTPAIEVLVPATYSPEPLLLPAFTAAAQTIPQGTHRCR